MDFPETNWAALAAASMNGGASEENAMDQLCREYWQPVASVIAGRGAPSERVEDLTQEFFIQLMEKSFFKKASPSKGRFRHFMLGALKFFLADDARRTLAAKRGGDQQRVHLSDDVMAHQVDQSQFDTAWAEFIFDRVFQSIQAHVKERRGDEGWEALQNFLPGAEETLSYRDLGGKLGITEGGAKAEVSRMRERFRTTLRDEVARTVGAPHEIDEELAYLRSALR